MVTHTWVVRARCSCGYLWTTPGSDSVRCVCGESAIVNNALVEGAVAVADEVDFVGAVAADLGVAVGELELLHEDP